MVVRKLGEAGTSSRSTLTSNIRSWKFVLKLYAFSLCFAVMSIIQFNILDWFHSHTFGFCYVGLTWFIGYVLLVGMFLLISRIRYSYPANWVLALLINICASFAVGFMTVYANHVHYLLPTAVWSLVAFVFFVALGSYVPRCLRPWIVNIALSIAFLIIGTACCLLVYCRVLTFNISFVVLIWPFPIVIYHIHLFNGYSVHGVPYNDLPLGTVFLSTDFLIAFVCLHWADSLTNVISKLHDE